MEIDELLEEITKEPELQPLDMEPTIQRLEQQLKEAKAEIKALKKLQAEEKVSEFTNRYEYTDEAKSFLKEFNALEFEKQDINEQMKELKTEAKENGVDVAAVIKAQKELIKELKEDTETAEIITQMKREISSDDALMTNTTILAG